MNMHFQGLLKKIFRTIIDKLCMICLWVYLLIIFAIHFFIFLEQINAVWISRLRKRESFNI